MEWFDWTDEEFNKFITAQEEYIFYRSTRSSYIVWFDVGGEVVKCEIPYELDGQPNPDKLDFEVNWKYKCNQRKSIAVGTGRQMGYSFYQESFKFIAPAMSAQKYSVKFNQAVLFKGGEYYIKGSYGDDDSIELMLTDEDNVLGYGAGFVLSTYLKNQFIVDPSSLFSSEVIRQEINGQEIDSNWIYFTCEYNNTSSNDLTVVIRYQVWKK